LLLAGLAFVALLPIVMPLLRPARAEPERRQFDKAVYRDQLAELDRDVTRSVLTVAEATGARLEIQRRLLAADASPSRATRQGKSPFLAACVALFTALGALGVYLVIGAPWVPDMPFASRATERARSTVADNHQDLRQVAAKLAERLKADPSDPDGWLLYARATTVLAQWDAAADAYHHAIALGRTGADVSAAYGEALVMQARGTVTPAAEEALRTALKGDPHNQPARFYLAVSASQAGEARKAIDLLQSLLADLPDNSPMRPEIGKRIDAAAAEAGIPPPPLVRGTRTATTGSPTAGGVPAGPAPDAVAAAKQMPPAEQQAMVRDMVDRLAARLQSAPDDFDGWMRLGRSYAVLGERDKAADAYDHASKLKPNETEAPLRAAEALLSGLKPSDPMPPRAVALLHHVEAVSPDQPAVLWYLGLFAAQGRQPDAARRYWKRLLAQLPADGEEATTVRSALEALGGK
jgi:cytochrome c-type biogenesis protein CcmH